MILQTTATVAVSVWPSAWTARRPTARWRSVSGCWRTWRTGVRRTATARPATEQAYWCRSPTGSSYRRKYRSRKPEGTGPDSSSCLAMQPARTASSNCSRRSASASRCRSSPCAKCRWTTASPGPWHWRASRGSCRCSHRPTIPQRPWRGSYTGYARSSATASPLRTTRGRTSSTSARSPPAPWSTRAC